MDVNKILSTDYIDLIFEGRNKVYGGYELRKNYPKRVMIALAVLAGIALMAVAYALINMNVHVEVKKKPVQKEVVLAELPPVDPKKLPPPPPPPPPVKPTVKFTPPVIKRDEEVKEEEVPPPQKEITASGPKDEKGDPNGIDPGIVAPPSNGVVAAPAAPAIFQFVEQQPEPSFDLPKYLQDHLHYPDAARESNTEGRVIVRFVVNEDGGVSDVTIQRGIGGGCDEEARRVVLAMPKWKAGKQNGKAVKVYFTLPIQFKLE
jgi:protein TonB